MKTKPAVMTRIVSGIVSTAAILNFGAGRATAQSSRDPLPSWNEGATKKAIVEFVRTTTDRSSSKFVPAPERIATFDQYGTLWVEHPMYSQVMYCLERVPALVKEKPELAKEPPFSTVLELLHGDRAAIEKLTLPDIEKIASATLTDISVETFQTEVKAWLTKAKNDGWTVISMKNDWKRIFAFEK